MRQTNVRPMVEGGILSAIAVIIGVASTYLPPIFVMIGYPLPITLMGVRNGIKWSIMATVVSAIIMAMFLGPLQAISTVVALGPIGIVLGYSFQKAFNPLKTMLWGTVTAFISIATGLTIASAVTINATPLSFVDQYRAMVPLVLEQTAETYRKIGITEAQLSEALENAKNMIKMMEVLIPVTVITALVSIVYLNIISAKLILKKLGHHSPDFPAFITWRMPKFVGYFALLAIAISYGSQYCESLLLKNISSNLTALVMLLLFIQGLALFYYLVDKYNLSRPVKSIILLLIMITPVFAQILICAGAMDIFMDYRRIIALKNKESE